MVSQNRDRITALRAELGSLPDGPPRARPLLELSQLLANDYWAAGPGQPVALPVLNEAIAALDSAYKCLDAKDQYRGIAAGNLGWLFGIRNLAHNGTDEDRETGVQLLEEALGFDRLSPILVGIWRTVLGQLYLSRAMQDLRDPRAAMTLIQQGGSAASKADADKAIECFKRILADPTSEEARTVAETMVTIAEAVRDLLDGMGAGGLDFSKMSRMMTALQTIQQTRLPGTNATPFNAGDAIAQLPVLDRPVPLVVDRDAPPPTATPAPAPSPAPEPGAPGTAVPPPRQRRAPSPDLQVLRHARSRQLAGVAGQPDGTPAEILSALLHPAGPPPARDSVDELVGLTTTLVYGGAPDAEDRVWHAAAMLLRARLDDDRDVLAAAGRSVHDAVAELPAGHPLAPHSPIATRSGDDSGADTAPATSEVPARPARPTTTHSAARMPARLLPPCVIWESTPSFVRRPASQEGSCCWMRLRLGLTGSAPYTARTTTRRGRRSSRPCCAPCRPGWRWWASNRSLPAPRPAGSCASR